VLLHLIRLRDAIDGQQVLETLRPLGSQDECPLGNWPCRIIMDLGDGYYVQSTADAVDT